MEFVSWDDDIPNIWKNNPFMFQTTNQANVIGLKNLKKQRKINSQDAALGHAPSPRGFLSCSAYGGAWKILCPLENDV
jgi:hypothetical protein